MWLPWIILPETKRLRRAKNSHTIGAKRQDSVCRSITHHTGSAAANQVVSGGKNITVEMGVSDSLLLIALDKPARSRLLLPHRL
jgi:hypothetical protein